MARLIADSHLAVVVADDDCALLMQLRCNLRILRGDD
jgi:hypothetical protein